jgi:uncharacterized protein (TIGR02246 family)
MHAGNDRAGIDAVVAGLEAAWNAGNGVAFASYFDEYADFVNIYGMHVQGRRKIAQGHDTILRTIYAGSTVHYMVTQVRFLRDSFAVVHLNALLNAPKGPLVGTHNSIPSMVMQRKGEDWSIAAFHNTLVQPPPTMEP